MHTSFYTRYRVTLLAVIKIVRIAPPPLPPPLFLFYRETRNALSARILSGTSWRKWKTPHLPLPRGYRIKKSFLARVTKFRLFPALGNGCIINHETLFFFPVHRHTSLVSRRANLEENCGNKNELYSVRQREQVEKNDGRSYILPVCVDGCLSLFPLPFICSVE